MDLEQAKKMFRVGVKVKLNAGGPVMSVKRIQDHVGELIVYCQWFAGRRLEEGDFAAETLVLVEEDQADAGKKS